LDRTPAPRPIATLAFVLLLGLAVPCLGQTLVSHFEMTSFSSGLPEETGSSWTRVGTGHALILSGGELLLNDNSAGFLVAYQGLLGRLEAVHDVFFRGEVRVISNLGGEAALIEISRPGMEVLVQLFPAGIVVMERAGRDEPRWLGSAEVDLSDFREIEVHKTSVFSPDPERVIVSVDGVELLRVQPRATGDLALGRVLFGSLGYADLGATIWRWVEVQVQLEEQKIPVQWSSVGRLKARFDD
jgi:hypothetical protein